MIAQRRRPQPPQHWRRRSRGQRQRPWAFAIIAYALVVLAVVQCQAVSFGQRDLAQLSVTQLSYLVSSHDPAKGVDLSNPSSHLSKILIPRAPGTDNNTLVRKYIASTLRALNWHIEEDSFSTGTPVGVKSFTNVIATHDPTAPRRIVLSAHFDSKYFARYPENQFVGATDSAAPCAMMLDLAEALTPFLNNRQHRGNHQQGEDDNISDTTLQLVFFDGEEAFHEWSDTDSIYGSRHLAQKWATTYLAPHPKRRLLGSAGSTELSGIEHFVLLDLLGAPNPTIQSYFLDTAWLFDGLVAAEMRLRDVGALDAAGKSAKDGWRSFFLPRRANDVNIGYIGDDHVPFLRRGVSVLHVIANPFPRVWHTLQDDASALDLPTMRRWNLILRVFMSEYLGLKPETARPRRRSDELT